jgi:hypothetical protein
MAAERLLTALLDFYRERTREAEDIDSSPILEAIAAELARCAGSETAVAPRTMSAALLLPDALAQVQSRWLALVEAIHETAPLFRWRQNSNYTAANMGADFMAGYGYVEFAGPKEALFHAPDVRVGLLLLGPHLHYPAHEHPAEEIYHPLTDGGLWRRGEERWRTVPSGRAIHHPPMIPHETKTANSTLLALYCWRGNTVTEAQLTA